MKLQRWHVARGGLDQGDCLDERGEWVRWADVLALLSRIRAAVEVERNARAHLSMLPGDKQLAGLEAARKALDALLAGGGA